jgi:hypothetical protein
MLDLVHAFRSGACARCARVAVQVAAMMTVGPSALAQPEPGKPPANEAVATELFDAGRDLLAAGRVAEACPKLAESVRLAAHVGSLGKLAECEERMGRLVSARNHWQRARNLARAQGDTRLDRVEAEIARMDRVVPRVLVVLPRVRPASLEVRVDDVVLSATALELPLPMDPGKHTVAVTGAGAPWSREVDLRADGAVTRVVVPALEAARTPPAAPPASEGAKRGVTALEVTGLVATGASVVSVAIGAYFAGITSARLDASNELGCSGDRCTPQGAAIRDEARRAGNAATAFIVAGSVVGAGGLALFLFSPGAGEKRATRPLTASVGVRNGAAGLSLEGSF